MRRRIRPRLPTLSFYLRDSAAAPPCTFGTRHRASPEPHPSLVPTRYAGRLRVSLLRQAFAVPLETSFAVIKLWYYLTMFTRCCQSSFSTNRPQFIDGHSPDMDKHQPGCPGPVCSPYSKDNWFAKCPLRPRETYSSSTAATPSTRWMASSSSSTLHFLFRRREKMAQAL